MFIIWWCVRYDFLLLSLFLSKTFKERHHEHFWKGIKPLIWDCIAETKLKHVVKRYHHGGLTMAWIHTHVDCSLKASVEARAVSVLSSMPEPQANNPVYHWSIPNRCLLLCEWYQPEHRTFSKKVNGHTSQTSNYPFKNFKIWWYLCRWVQGSEFELQITSHPFSPHTNIKKGVALKRWVCFSQTLRHKGLFGLSEFDNSVQWNLKSLKEPYKQIIFMPFMCAGSQEEVSLPAQPCQLYYNCHTHHQTAIDYCLHLFHAYYSNVLRVTTEKRGHVFLHVAVWGQDVVLCCE